MDTKVIVAGKKSAVGDSRITVVRMDPKFWELEFAGISSTDETEGRTAREWCEKLKLSVCINAGMFAVDYKTHVGYARSRGHINSGSINDYESVAAFDPQPGKELPLFRIFDLDEPGVDMEDILKNYGSAVQNLRLIKRPAVNRWGQQQKKWSEAALGEDRSGRILFIFSRSPFSMHDLNQELIASGIGIVASQHLEGGPEAQVYLHVGAIEQEMFGSYETSFNEDDGNTAGWPIPNILGVRPKIKQNTETQSH